MINLKEEGGWLCSPSCTQQALNNEKNLGGSVHLLGFGFFFFLKRRVPGASILSECFQRKDIIVCSFPIVP